VFVQSVNGDYNNVVGLPIAAIWQYFYGNGGLDVNASL
jgi:predicted house-cleaning NTP pyrophosphatase (Maf/HAM1 superfamily)